MEDDFESDDKTTIEDKNHELAKLMDGIWRPRSIIHVDRVIQNGLEGWKKTEGVYPTAAAPPTPKE